MENKRFLSIAQACAWLGVSRSRMYVLCDTGKITYYKNGGRTSPLRFRYEDLERFRNEGKHESK